MQKIRRGVSTLISGRKQGEGHSNGKVEKVAKLLLAMFFNNGKLTAVAPHIFKAEADALPSFLAPPTEKGLGRIESGSLEQL